MSSFTFNEVLQQLSEHPLLTAVLSSPWLKSLEVPLKINIRPLLIKNQPFYQASLHYKQKVIHQNLTKNECINFIQKALLNDYKQATLSFAEHSFHILINKDKKMTILQKANQTKALPMAH